MRSLFYGLLLLIIFGCDTYKSISRNVPADEWRVSYTFIDSAKKMQNSNTIHVVAVCDKCGFAYRYWFFTNTDFVQKSKAVRAKAITDYYLVYDSSHTYKVNKWDSISIDNSQKIKGKHIELSRLDISVFEKIIYYADSMKLNDFSHLRQAKSFKVVATKENL